MHRGKEYGKQGSSSEDKVCLKKHIKSPINGELKKELKNNPIHKPQHIYNFTKIA